VNSSAHASRSRVSRITYATNPRLDESALIALLASAWGGPPDPAYPRVLAHSLLFVAAFDAERLVGFANVATDGGVHAFLLDPTVDPDFQRQGIGTALVRLAARESVTLGCEWLHVDYEAHLAPFYAAAGFKATAAGIMRLERVV
jgi:GNAT superfamily N-acetyltransferase